MSRKTHPTSHRLGVTLWWPSRTPTTGRPSRGKGVQAKNIVARYSQLKEIIKGFLVKFGYKITMPRIVSTINSTGRIVLIVSPTGTGPLGRVAPLGAVDSTIQEVPHANENEQLSLGQGDIQEGLIENNEQEVLEGTINQEISKENNLALRSLNWKSTLALAQYTSYISTYLTTLITEYEQKAYTIEILEIQDELTQGTSGIIAQSIVNSDRSLVPTMGELQRRVSKIQASQEQRQAYVQRVNQRAK